MHINFATRRRFSFNLNSRPPFDRFLMLVLAGVMLGFMLLFGLVQKLRLDHLVRQKNNIDNIAIVSEDAGVDDEGSAFARYEKRTVWSGILKELTSVIPDYVWLTSIKNDKANMVMINGEAPDQGAVSELASYLQKADSFNEVKILSSVSTAEKDGKNKTVFSIQCRLKVK